MTASEQFLVAYADVNRAVMVGDRLVAPLGLTLIQAHVIVAVSRQEAAQPTHVKQALGCSSQTTVGVLDRLERDGWLTRQRDLPDRRAVRLALTTEALGRLPEIKAETERASQAAMGAMRALVWA